MLDFNGAPDRLWWGGEVSEVYSGSDLVWIADAGQFIHKKGNFDLNDSWLSLGEVTLDVRGGVFVGMKYFGTHGGTMGWAVPTPEVRLSSGSRVETFSFPRRGAFTHMGAAHWVDPGTWHVEIRRPSEGSAVSGIEEFVVAASSSKGMYSGWDHERPEGFNDRGSGSKLYGLRTVAAPVRSRRLVTVRGEFRGGGSKRPYPSSAAEMPQVKIGGHMSRNIDEGEFSFWEIVDGPTEVSFNRNHENSSGLFGTSQNVFFDGRVEYIDLPFYTADGRPIEVHEVSLTDVYGFTVHPLLTVTVPAGEAWSVRIQGTMTKAGSALTYRPNVRIGDTTFGSYAQGATVDVSGTVTSADTTIAIVTRASLSNNAASFEGTVTIEK